MVVEELYAKLYELYLKELKDLKIGYSFNVKTLTDMFELINVITLLENTVLPSKDMLKIMEKYK